MKETEATFLGIKPLCKITNYEDEFDVLYNADAYLLLISKGTFVSEKDKDIPYFEYKYIIKCIDLYAYGSDSKEISIEMFMCPTKEYVNKNILQNICKEYGTNWCTDIQYYTDIQDNEALPNFGTEYISYSEEDIPLNEYGNRWYDYYYNLLKCSELVNKLNVAGTAISFIDRTRGFNLDKIWNALGNTGWDLLKSLLNGEDWIQIGIDRCKQAM